LPEFVKQHRPHVAALGLAQPTSGIMRVLGNLRYELAGSVCGFVPADQGRKEMNTRKIGASGLVVSPLAFGGNVFGWTADEATSFRLLDAFVAAGFNFIDTADVYSRWVPGHQGGESETIIGRWLSRRAARDRVVIATKVGLEMGSGRKGLAKAYILEAVEKSLARLQTDYIDLYQSHQDDSATPLEETLSAFDQLIKQGKVRAIGASNYTAERLALALEVSRDHHLARYECLQPLYNLSDRAVFESALEPLCRKAGIGVIPYYSLAAGFLTGKYRSEKDLAGRARAETVKKHFSDRGLRILNALDQVAAHHGGKPAQVALAWLLARPGITTPIVSATNLDQLAEILESPDLKLDTWALDILNQASA
jgi:aryl-alcohol dehydrogenase-like predicted oxidoreductase